MKLSRYLKDKLYIITLFLVTYIIILMLLLAFKVDSSLIIVISILFIFLLFLILIIEYLRKQTFYKSLLNNIKELDKAYLVLETLEEPSFYEGKLVYQALYDINKSMSEIVKLQENAIIEFKEYIEMWIHEVKIPISTLFLMQHNHKEKFPKKAMEQIENIESYVEQILYYVRSENPEHDYLIRNTNLAKVISNVALKNKEKLLESKIDFKVDNVNIFIYTDTKWLEFILNQIIDNSIKYKKDSNSYIKIDTEETSKEIALNILDNGIGINEADLKRVFEKTFTGSNGRIKAKSTGMGLYIAKKMCHKLGHNISIDSKENEYTKVSITFYKNEFYEVVK